MKSLSAFAFFLSLIVPGYSQINVIWGGQQVASPKNSHITSIIGCDDTRIYTLKEKQGFWGHHPLYYLDSYSRKNLVPAGTGAFSLPRLPERSNILERVFGREGKYQTAGMEKLLLIKGSLLLFSSYYNRNEKRNYAFVQTLTANGTPGSAYRTLDTIQAEGRHDKGNYGFILSGNQNHILDMYTEPGDKHVNARLSLKLFDSSMNLSWSKMLELPYAKKLFHLTRTMVDDKGDVYFLANIEKDARHTEKHKPAYHYSILSYSNERNQLREYTIDLDDKFISDITFRINAGGDLICAGFYSKSSESSAAGCFFLKIDKETNEVTEHTVREFAKDFLLEFMSDRKIEKGRELYNFDIGNLLLRPDGSAIMIAEQYFMDVVSYYNPASHSYNYSYHYYYNDIIVLGFDAKGEIILQKKISKYQHSVNDGGPYASFALADGGDMLHFIYNDNPENTHRSETELDHGHVSSMNNPGHSVVVMVSMDMKGNTQRTQLLDNHSHKNYSWFMPKMNKTLDSNEVILFAQKGRYFRFGRITL
ncbi:MAG: hypothetical protein ACHQRM_09170 [Bacteroidia bacterium]